MIGLEKDFFNRVLLKTANFQQILVERDALALCAGAPFTVCKVLGGAEGGVIGVPLL